MLPQTKHMGHQQASIPFNHRSRSRRAVATTTPAMANPVAVRVNLGIIAWDKQGFCAVIDALRREWQILHST